jgi:poly [ADP-ribose] polymerase
MSKVAKLVMVSEANNNKFYHMKEDPGGGTFSAHWGRIGLTETVTVYPMSKWESTIKSKLKKGYVDQTDLFVVDSAVVDFSAISDSAINRIVDRLQSFAKGIRRKELYGYSGFRDTEAG